MSGHYLGSLGILSSLKRGALNRCSFDFVYSFSVVDAQLEASRFSGIVMSIFWHMGEFLYTFDVAL